MNTGSPPTARNARTGEFTPPGITCRARSNRALDTESLMGRQPSTYLACACAALAHFFAVDVASARAQETDGHVLLGAGISPLSIVHTETKVGDDPKRGLTIMESGLGGR